MKKLFLFVAASLVAFYAPNSSAQSCGGMYTYTDAWIDSSTGNAVLLNYADGDSSCGDYSANAYSNVALNSGYYLESSAGGGCCAETIVLAPGQIDDGLMNVSNQVTYSCGSEAFFAGGFPVKLNAGSEFIWYDSPVLISLAENKCGYFLVEHCSRADGLYCGDANPTQTGRCVSSDGQAFTQLLHVYGYAEVKLGPLLVGSCLGFKEGSESTAAEPQTCRAVPTHIATD